MGIPTEITLFTSKNETIQLVRITGNLYLKWLDRKHLTDSRYEIWSSFISRKEAIELGMALLDS